MTSTVTMDFREEYEAERTRWLRRRVLWYCGVSLALIGTDLLISLALLAAYLLHIATSQVAPLAITLDMSTNAISLAVFAAALIRAARQRLSADRLLRMVYWVIVSIGLLSIVVMPLVTKLGVPVDSDEQAQQSVKHVGPLFLVFEMHVLAALFIPWTPRQAIRPLVPLLAVSAVITLVFSPASFVERLVFVVLSPLVGVPGVLIGWWRHSRFRQKFQFKVLRGHYGTMKRELADARRIHEVLFPPRIDHGPLRFDYRYEPMRQIGGDYLYLSMDESRDGCEPRLSVVIIDVTGHGIGAALTVNRIHGELERLFGEDGGISPGRTLAALNHYINVTLAKHNVYATALCLRVDPHREVVEWASAGHPPAFVRTVGGFVERLEPTAIMLGASRDEEFDPAQQTLPLKRGDSVIAYTDGVIEARDPDGRMLTIDGIQRLIAALPTVTDSAGYAQDVMAAVREHRSGAAKDDTLIVEVRRLLE